jgi:ABC-2 type transport system ATP-binding protein
MADGQIVVSGLTKQFRRVRAVDNLSFTVEPGRVTGFLGPNGAGKTTTLRMLLGLVAPTAGNATIGGQHYADLPDPLRVVGAGLEAASFHKGRTGRDHLRVLCAAGGLPYQRADEALEMVGLSPAAKRKVKGYSLGMKQRLGIAAGMLGDPTVLIFDEPANGLDPEGIRWMRDLLSEVQLFADDVVIIAAGQLIRQGPVSELTDADGMQRVRVRTPEPQKLLAELKAPGTAVQTEEDGALLVTGVPAAAVGHAALVAGVELHELSPQRADLERIFLELTSGKAGIR